jgi:hypothetical protein
MGFIFGRLFKQTRLVAHFPTNKLWSIIGDFLKIKLSILSLLIVNKITIGVFYQEPILRTLTTTILTELG